MLHLKSSHRDTGLPKTTLDLTPMLDVVFILLIFFLLTSIVATQPVLNLRLPTTSHAESMRPGKPLEVVIRKGGEIEIDALPVSLSRLEAVLKASLEEKQDQKILISADQDAPFGRFVQVLDLVQRLKLSDLSILTTPVQQAGRAEGEQEVEQR